MNIRIRLLLILLCFLLFGFLPSQKQTFAAESTIRAVLFYSPTCPHCHVVMNEVLPPLIEQYQGQLIIVGIDVTHEVGQTIYQDMLVRYNVPDNRIGVPALVIGDQLLVGSVEIPNLLPSIIESGLSNNGIDWPEIPSLMPILEAQNLETTPAATQSSNLSMWDRFLLDPVANSVAVAVLVGMIFVVVIVGHSFLNDRSFSIFNWRRLSVPILAAIGFGTAAYLSYVEISHNEAICGPVGDCNSVQQSPYATLFGVIPVGVLGALGYIAILLAWILAEYGPTKFHKSAVLASWGMSWFGILFSIYLTFLEPFVIGATCAWCITSAIVITLLLLATTGPALEVMRVKDEDLHGDEDYDDDDENTSLSPEGLEITERIVSPDMSEENAPSSSSGFTLELDDYYENNEGAEAG